MKFREFTHYNELYTLRSVILQRHHANRSTKCGTIHGYDFGVTVSRLWYDWTYACMEHQFGYIQLL